MARGSGNAAEAVIPGSFTHSNSGIRYSVFLRDGKAWMSYGRGKELEDAGGAEALHGERQLIYFIGSGHRGRTYLYEESGEWFEAPINYYSKKQVWDMAPNFGAAKTMPAALPVDSNCLHCHATGVQAALPEARNKYAAQPFLQGGIGCSSCHGDSSEHLAEYGQGAILNPAKLNPVRRDSVCLQCHLEGNIAIYRSGKSLAQFHAGDKLADFAVYFVKASAEAGGGRAVSQYEALLRSACKVASGDKLTCTTCHDPHNSPRPEERVSYFRNKCLTCHTGVQMATKHHPEQQDCAACHMPTRETTDISHEQTTDHDIQIRPPTNTPALQLADLTRPEDLVPVGGVPVSDREVGLAYAQLAEHGNQKAGERALELLRKAELQGDDDVEVHTQLGFLEQMSGDKERARKEYANALKEAPYDATAMGNLAILDAASGDTAEAVNLLQRVVNADPSQMAAGLDLAFIDCRMDKKDEAKEILTRLTRLDPDDPVLRRFMSYGEYGGQRCQLR
ncbi:MAG TPA: tetratricopeptide repeat protein [Silvibacterium sp.]|nr:tetratricopeptide repeat protein [Silvibacterium sp.]